jgi:hypothetical protein
MCLDLEINPFNKESNFFKNPLITSKERMILLIRKNVISMKSNPMIKMVHVKRRIVKDNTVIPNNKRKRTIIRPGRKGSTEIFRKSMMPRRSVISLKNMILSNSVILRKVETTERSCF